MKHIKSYRINESKEVLKASIENAIENNNMKLLAQILKTYKNEIVEHYPDNALLIYFMASDDKYHKALPTLIKYRNSDRLNFQMFSEVDRGIYRLAVNNKEYNTLIKIFKTFRFSKKLIKKLAKDFARLDKLDLFKLLVSHHGFDINYKSHWYGGTYGHTLIIEYTLHDQFGKKKKERSEIFHWLINQPGIDLHGYKDGEQVLKYVVKYGGIREFDALMKKDSFDLTIKSPTIMYCAIEGGDPKIVFELLKYPEVEVTRRHLQQAIKIGNPYIIKALEQDPRIVLDNLIKYGNISKLKNVLDRHGYELTKKKNKTLYEKYKII